MGVPSAWKELAHVCHPVTQCVILLYPPRHVNASSLHVRTTTRAPPTVNRSSTTAADRVKHPSHPCFGNSEPEASYAPAERRMSISRVSHNLADGQAILDHSSHKQRGCVPETVTPSHQCAREFCLGAHASTARLSLELEPREDRALP